MTVQLRLDATDFLRVARQFNRLPYEMQRVAFGRAAARTKGVVMRNYARFASSHIKVPQKHITKRMRAKLVNGGVDLVVRSSFIPLHEIGARAQHYGVYVRGRGRYEGVFMPRATSRRAAGYVLKRRPGAGRLPANMMFGPNPAHAVERTPAVYEDLLRDIAANEFWTVIAQQIVFLMGRA